MRRLLCLLIAVFFFTGISAAAPKGTHGASHTSRSSPKAKSSAPKPVHVREYTRKDGTVVHAHDRALPGTATHSSPAVSPRPTTYRPDYIASGLRPHPSVTLDSHGRIVRTKAARAEFIREHPCPATGRTSGACPGYVVDHVNALECGGADAPSNMQWQTVAAGEAKDRTERYCKLP